MQRRLFKFRVLGVAVLANVLWPQLLPLVKPDYRGADALRSSTPPRENATSWLARIRSEESRTVSLQSLPRRKRVCTQRPPEDPAPRAGSSEKSACPPPHLPRQGKPVAWPSARLAILSRSLMTADARCFHTAKDSHGSDGVSMTIPKLRRRKWQTHLLGPVVGIR